MSRRRVVGVLIALVSLPALVAAVDAFTYERANRLNGSIIVAGTKRDFSLYVPATVDGTRAVPLVISLHGAGLAGSSQRAISGWDRVAQREGFIVVYPSGLRGKGPRIWHMGDGDEAVDVAFIGALIDTIAAHHRIDRSRVYVNGLSAGGGMSWVLSCRMSDRIAAVGLVAPALLLPVAWCPDSNPMPMIQFNGTDDWQVPYRGGWSDVAFQSLPSVEPFVATWAKRNHCAPAPVDSSVNAAVRRRAYGGCARGADVVLYTIHGGGHTWPGGKVLAPWWAGPTSNAVSATEEMWAFFKQKRR